METTMTAEIIEGIGYGIMFAVFYFAPSIIRNLPGNTAVNTSGIYTNENGSACSRRSY